MRTSALAFIPAAAALAACGDNLPDPSARPPAEARAFITVGDFQATGLVTTVDLPSMWVDVDAVSGVAGADPIVRRLGDEIAIVNRFNGDNVVVLDADALQQVDDQMATGAGTNPQDAAAVGRKLYVPALGGPGVVVLDRDHPGTPTTIDLSRLDPDGKPDCSSAYAVDDRVYVICGLLPDGMPPARGNAVVAVIDSADDHVVTTFEVASQNPLGQLVRTPEDSIYGGDLVIGTVPDFGDPSTGCLARIGVGARPGDHGCVASNRDLGGYVNRVDVAADGKALWLAVASFDADFHARGRMVRLDLATGVRGEPVSPDSQVVTDLACCPGGWVVAADTTMGASGLRIYKDGVEQTTRPLSIGQPISWAAYNLTCL